MLVILTQVPQAEVLKRLKLVFSRFQTTEVRFVKAYNDLQSVISLGGVRAVYSLGSQSLEMMQLAGHVPKNRKVTGLRKQVLYIGHIPLMVSYSPMIYDADYRQFVDLLTDTGTALRLATTGSISPVYGEYHYIQSLAEVVDGVKSLMGGDDLVELAADTETLGLDRFAEGGYIISFQFSWKGGHGVALAFHSKDEMKAFFSVPENKDHLAFLFNDKRISTRFANGKYDLEWIYEMTGVNCTNFRFDTTLVGSLLDENRCVTPETRLLTHDLRWVPATSVSIGDKLLAFDEHCSLDESKGRFCNRQMVETVVTDISALKKRCYSLTLESGKQITVSDNHQFLVDEANSSAVWRHTEHISVGRSVRTFPSALEDLSYDSGWMSGFLEGEGWVTTQKGNGRKFWRMGIAQRDNVAYKKAQALLQRWGLKFYSTLSNYYTKKDGTQAECWQIGLNKGDGFALLQRTRPERLLLQKPWLNTPLPTVRDKVVKKELVGCLEVLAITTTSHTFIAAGICSHNSNALDVHCKIYAPELGSYSDSFDDKADKSRMDLEYVKDPEGFLNYSVGDSDATLRVSVAQKADLLKDKALTGFYVNILHPAARAFELVERGGVVVDPKAFDELEADLVADSHRLIKQAKSIVGGLLTAKHYDESKHGGLNLTKASLIKDFMFSPQGLNLKPKMMTTGGPKGDKPKVPSTAMEHLEMFKDVPEAKEFVSLMSEYSSTTKTLGTYVKGFRAHVRSDGRLHPNYWLFVGNKDEGDGGTNTGRTSCTGPAWQTVPKRGKWAKRLRRCYSAPPGMLVCTSDYIQGELKVVACIANETSMLSAYKAGLDLHVKTGGSVVGLNYEQTIALKVADKDRFDFLRQLAKSMNFGLLYGMGVDGFLEYARLNYGVTLSHVDAEKFRNEFFATYPLLITYHKEYKAHAHKYGFVRSPLGRVRHLPLINSSRQEVRAGEERKAINSAVQGTLSDMVLWTIAIRNTTGENLQAPCFGAVHDEGDFYLPEDNYQHHAKSIVHTMENLPFHKVGWAPQLKFTAEVKVGPNMGDLSDVEF